MRVVIQRVSEARVKVNSELINEINSGYLVFLAIHQEDKEELIEKMAEKIINLRIFEDQDGKMNLSIKEIDGEILVVSQFTLYGDTRRGNRPSFIESARPEIAEPFYEKFIKTLSEKGVKKVGHGKFGALMSVELVNDGPTTIIIDL
ncbi:MAG: D-aminoacyl-tRNA deacylase [Patescibacteria group bacterium]